VPYTWVTAESDNPNNKITLYATRGVVSFDIAITVDGGSYEDTAPAMGEIKEALEDLGFDVQSIQTGGFLPRTLQEQA